MHDFLSSYDEDDVTLLLNHLRKRVDTPAKTSGLGIVYDLTYLCNLKCKGCGVYAKHYLGRNSDDLNIFEATTEDVLLVLKKIKYHLENNCIKEYFINFGGGEPFIRSDIMLILEQACDLFGSNRLGIDTNGTLLSIEQIRKLPSLVSYLGVSLDGLKEYHNWWRNENNTTDETSFDATVNTIRNIISNHQVDILEVSSVATTTNLSQLPDLVNFLVELGVKKYSIHRAMPVGRMSKRPELVPRSQDYIDMLIRVLRVAKGKGIEVHFHHSIESIYATLLLGAETYAGRKIGEPDKRSSIGIDPYGRVYFDPWCMVSPWNQLSGGSLLDKETLQEILDTDILTIATEYSSFGVRCGGCSRPCSGGSRIAAATLDLSKAPLDKPSLTKILSALTATDSACPIADKA